MPKAAPDMLNSLGTLHKQHQTTSNDIFMKQHCFDVRTHRQIDVPTSFMLHTFITGNVRGNHIPIVIDVLVNFM